MVCFVEHKMFHVGQVEGLVPQMIQQPSWTGHYDLNACSQFSCLGLFADPTINGKAAQPCLTGQPGDLAVDLLSQFSCRYHYKGPDPAARPLEHAL